MDISTISSIQIARLSESEFNTFSAKFKRAREIRSDFKKNTFDVGDTVSFIKQGRKYVGDITKICPKNIKMKVGTVQWTVHPSFITREA